MKVYRILALAALVLATATIATAQAMEQPQKPEHAAKTEHPQAEGDLVKIAGGAENLSSLVKAIEAAGLVEKFQGPGPYTVFAPTDEAFAALPEGTLEDLLEPANKAKLAGILANHVVPGMIMAADVKTMKAANISGQDLDIVVKDGTVTVNGAKVVQADLAATNGVIHVIDKVILPAESAENTAADKPKDHPAH
jgi:uncharacterized surface protein with fasciclin (FAS1) repeats